MLWRFHDCSIKYHIIWIGAGGGRGVWWHEWEGEGGHKPNKALIVMYDVNGIVAKPSKHDLRVSAQILR